MIAERSLSPLERPVILLTGVTGGLGAELLPRLLTGYPAHEIVAPIRGASDELVAARLNEVLDFGGLAGDERDRVSALRAELAAERFGLRRRLWRSLASRTTAVFHLAADVNFSASLAHARSVNVVCTERVLEFGRTCVDAGRAGFRLNHVSTAYVCGKRRGLLGEEELHEGEGFWNAYEQSKNEAERLVRACRRDVPLTVYRPSQIIGDSVSGRTRKYFGLYEILKIAHRGKLRSLPGDARARQDMVPIDYVCDAMVCLSREPNAVGRTFHLAAGLARSVSLARAVELIHGECYAGERGGRAVPLPRIEMPPEPGAGGSDAPHERGAAALVRSVMTHYLPYLAYERDFEVSRTRSMLHDAGIAFPAIERALRETARYAIGTRFE